MQVILREDVEHLGRIGDMVNVADGFGRNFLLPRKKAVLATMKNVKALDHEKRVIAERAKKLLDESTALARRVAAVSITVDRQAGEEDKLFGSVTAMDIHEQSLAVDEIEILRQTGAGRDIPLLKRRHATALDKTGEILIAGGCIYAIAHFSRGRRPGRPT